MSHSVSLRITQKDMCKEAARLANERAREEFLDPRRYQGLPARLVSALKLSLPALQHDWAPFVPDFHAPTGLGVKLDPQADGLIRQLMAGDDSYTILREIGFQAVQDTVISQAPDFLNDVLNDLYGRGTGFYQKYTERD